MSELSSCYFCGTALDAPVRRYPLTPSDIDVDTGRTISLCPSCRRKLGKVLTLVADEIEATVDELADAEATEAEADGDGAVAATADTAADEDVDSDDTADGESEADEAAEAASEGDDAADVSSEAVTETEAEDSVDWELPEDETDAESSEDDEAEVESETDEDAEAEPEPDEDDAVTAESSEGAGNESADDGSDAWDAAGQSAGEQSDQSAAGDGIDGPSSGGQVDESPSGGQTAGQAEGGQTAGANGGGGGKPEVLRSASAKKVIRLLQNRDFPVEREEFEVIAQNAYDIPLHDCQDVVDALVEEGYVGQEGGMLVREE